MRNKVFDLLRTALPLMAIFAIAMVVTASQISVGAASVAVPATGTAAGVCDPSDCPLPCDPSDCPAPCKIACESGEMTGCTMKAVSTEAVTKADCCEPCPLPCSGPRLESGGAQSTVAELR